MYLILFHGRKIDPKTLQIEELDDWGSEGPVFKFDGWVHGTYAADLKFGDDEEIGCLSYHDGLIFYDGIGYGDFIVSGTLEKQHRGRLQKFDEKKADPGPFRRQYVVGNPVDEDVTEFMYERPDPYDPEDEHLPEGGWVADVTEATRYTLAKAQELCSDAKKMGRGFKYVEVREMAMDEFHTLSID